MHSAHQAHYRQMCNRLFGEYIPHIHENVFGVSAREAQAYDKTKAFYSEVFMGPPTEKVWEANAEAKVLMRTQMFRFVNMYRVASMYCMKQIDPQFLKPPEPPAVPQEQIQ